MEFIGKVTFYFPLKYCGANEFCRLYIKPSVRNKVAHVQNKKSV